MEYITHLSFAQAIHLGLVEKLSGGQSCEPLAPGGISEFSFSLDARLGFGHRQLVLDRG